MRSCSQGTPPSTILSYGSGQVTPFFRSVLKSGTTAFLAAWWCAVGSWPAYNGLSLALKVSLNQGLVPCTGSTILHSTVLLPGLNRCRNTVAILDIDVRMRTGRGRGSLSVVVAFLPILLIVVSPERETPASDITFLHVVGTALTDSGNPNKIMLFERHITSCCFCSRACTSARFTKMLRTNHLHWTRHH